MNRQNNVLAIVSLVLGILSIVLGWCAMGLGGISILFGIGGIFCAEFANRQSKTRLAKVGMICSVIGIVLGAILVIVIPPSVYRDVLGYF